MLNYKIRYIEYNGKVDDMVFEFEKERELLSTFLSVEVSAFDEWVKEVFDKVLSGKSEYEEFNGNICAAEISPKVTKIYDMLAEDDEYESTHCEVDTQELRELMDEWINKVKKLKNSRR